MNEQPLPCPFCGAVPEVWPLDPKREGNAWGEVVCCNPECHCRPRVGDGQLIGDERGSDAYKAAAIARWNQRAAA